MIHLYYGNGKGKTTAAAGAALRMAGQGGRVLFAQFLKSPHSGEVEPLRQCRGIEVMPYYPAIKFTAQMTPAERTAAAQWYQGLWIKIAAHPEQYDLMIFDELCDALNAGFVHAGAVRDFLFRYGQETEVIVTGHHPADFLFEAADYITHMEGRRHPYTKGIEARRGVEY